MIIKTFDAILNELCNEFDTAISPSKLARSNANIIYLLLKSISKGMEALNNTVIALRNKFNPVNCEIEDLISIAKLVGTAKYAGSASGLQITVTNTGTEAVIIEPGTYEYRQSEEEVFRFVNATRFDLPPKKNNTKVFIAMSTERKAIHITAQDTIAVKLYTNDTEGNPTVEGTISDFLNFSCADNAGLQGAIPETDLEFRNRVIQGKSTATLFNRIETEVSNLPYIFSCNLRFNNSSGPMTIGDIMIDPYKLLVIINGSPDSHVAEIIASHGIYETQKIEGVTEIIRYENDIFTDKAYEINYMKPTAYEYGLDIYYEADPKAISDTVLKDTIIAALEPYKTANSYKELITEREFSNFLSGLGISTLQILNVDLTDIKTGEKVDYIKIPIISLPRLTTITLHNMTE